MRKWNFLHSRSAICTLATVTLFLPLQTPAGTVSIDVSGPRFADDINGLDYKVPFNSIYSFTVSASSPDTVNGATLGLLMYSPDGSMINATVSVPTFHSAWDDPAVWNLGGAQSNVTLLGDGILPDQYLTGGAAFTGAGFIQPALAPIFSFDVAFGLDDGVFCVDSAFFPPSGVWLFSVPGVGDFAPDWIAGSGDGAVGGTRTSALCLTVFAPPDDPPVFTICPGPVTSSYCNSSSINSVAEDPEGVSSISYSVSHNGQGSATISESNGNGTYVPAVGDVGNTVLITVTATESDGPSSECVIERTVTSSLPSITCPPDFVLTQGNTVQSSLPTMQDDDASCESHSYSLVSVTPAPLGVVSVNSANGRVTFAADENEPVEQVYEICIRVVSGAESAACCINATVVEGCCALGGDSNHDGVITIDDVVFMVSRIFFGAPAGPCQDQEDANGDNKVNIIDVIYPIEYIFRGYPAPVCGTTGS